MTIPEISHYTRLALNKMKEDHKLNIIKSLKISYDELKEIFNRSLPNFLNQYQDSDVLDFINDQIQISENIINEVRKLRINDRMYSIKKYIKFLYQELEYEKKNQENISKFNIIDSNKPRIEVIYFMLILKEMGIFKFENDHALSRFIDRNCKFDKGKKIINSKQTISNIKNKEISVEKYNIKFQEFLKSQSLL